MTSLTPAASAVIARIQARMIADWSANVGSISPSLDPEALYVCWDPDPADLPDPVLIAISRLPIQMLEAGVDGCLAQLKAEHATLLEQLVVLRIVDDGADVFYEHYGAGIQAASRVNLTGMRQGDWVARTAIASYYLAGYRASAETGRVLYTENITAPQFATRTWTRLIRPIRGRDGVIEGFLVANTGLPGFPHWPAVMPLGADASRRLDCARRHNLFVIGACRSSQRFSETSMSTLLDDGPMPLALVVPELTAFRYVNKRFLQVMGLKVEDMATVTPERLFTVPQMVRDAVRQTITAPVRDLEVVLQRPDGSPIYAVVHLSRFEHVGGQTIALWMLDVTQRRQLEAELRALTRDLSGERDELARLKTMAEQDARHDALTNLHNRRSLEELLAGEIDLARREGRSVWVVYMGLDQFKAINDRHGTGIGDQMLREVAGRLRKVARGADLVGRVGGDEFVVLLRGGSRLDEGEQAAQRAASRFSVSLAEPFRLVGTPVTISVSIGIAAFPLHAETASSLLRQANAAMHEAKVAGGGRVVVSTTRAQPVDETDPSL